MRNGKFSSVQFKLAPQIIKNSLVLLHKYIVHISNDLLSSFPAHTHRHILRISISMKRRRRRKEARDDTRIWTDSLFCTFVVGRFRSAPPHRQTINNKKSSITFVIFHKNHSTQEVHAAFETKDEGNETNYKMLEEIFYLLRNVIVRIPFIALAFIPFH